MKKAILLFVAGLLINSSCNNKDNQQQFQNQGTEKTRIEVCSECRGGGKLKCKKCDGTGTIKDPSSIFYEKYIDCDNCNGFGYFVCSKCGGNGYVTAKYNAE